jgi:Right handed beta helix region
MIAKNLRTRMFLFLIAALAACFAAQSASAATVVVGTCVTTLTHFNTIGAAIAAVPAGSTVEVCPGNYPEQLSITKKLTLIGLQSGTSGAAVVLPPSGGLGMNATDIFGNPVAAQIFVDSPAGAVTIEHITVDGTGNNVSGCAPNLEGIYFQNTSGTVTNNAVRNQYLTNFAVLGGCQSGLAINIEATTSANSVTISGNSVRAYQKNGITASGAGTGAGSLGPSVTINNNYIVGLAATAMNWQGVYLNQSTAAENGIQVGFGASGKVEFNTVNDNIWGQDTSSDTGDAASGILIFASPNITVTGNEVGSAQFGIVADTDGSGFCGTTSSPISCGTADGTTITSNKVAGTQLFDGIEACSNGNTITTNDIFGSTESGVHFDDSCSSSSLGTTSGNSNSASKNVIVEACAGILLGTGTTGNTATPNTIFDVTNTTLAGDVCPVPVSPDVMAASHATGRKLRPSPYRLRK